MNFHAKNGTVRIKHLFELMKILLISISGTILKNRQTFCDIKNDKYQQKQRVLSFG